MLYGISTNYDKRKLMDILELWLCMELKLRYTSRSHQSNTRVVYINTICICHNYTSEYVA